MNELRPNLPPDMPERMKALPVSDRGYPVPWFVQWLNEEGGEEPMPIGQGYPEFRMMRGEARNQAIQGQRCWVCGQTLGKYKSFVIGPMCAVNRTTAEPPCHRDCAEWSARACPFLANPKMVRRDNKMTDKTGNMPGEGLLRNPKVSMVWTTTSFNLFPDGKGSYLIEIGPPEDVTWFAKGGDATRAEIEESLESGMPLLEATIPDDAPEDEKQAAYDELRRRREAVDPLLPIAA